MTDKASGALLRSSAVFKGVPAKEIESLIQVTQTDIHRPREFI